MIPFDIKNEDNKFMNIFIYYPFIYLLFLANVKVNRDFTPT